VSAAEITSWEHRYEFRSGKVAHTDYNFKTPTTSLMATTNTLVEFDGVSKYEVYDYPGAYPAKGDGDAEVKFRMEEVEAGHDTVAGAGQCRTFTPGGKFTLKTHPSDGEKGKGYVLTSVSHHAAEVGGYETSGPSGELDYSNSFQCIPDKTVFRPERTTPKAVVQGAQTAVVVGPGGEEIHCDEFGRVKVQFHWDREGAMDDKSSCWVRVSQAWAGKGFGFVHIPRIGEEVIVDFLEGDPDRPIITGRVYHAENMPPYGLPDNKTQTGLKSRSSKGGSEDNFNEIRLEDLKGEEEVYIHAEKDQKIVVENDEAHSVGNDRKKSVEHDESTTIGNDRTESVGNDESITIGRNRVKKVQKNETTNVAENRNESVGKNESIDIGSEKSETIGKDGSWTIGANRNLSVKKADSIDVGESRSTQVGKDDKLDIGKKLTVVAGDEIVIKTGKASLTMKKSGEILLEGKDIKLKGSGKINIEASKDVTIKGSKIKEN
jgi:type VI secretion system secreted protein VgrG